MEELSAVLAARKSAVDDARTAALATMRNATLVPLLEGCPAAPPTCWPLAVTVTVLLMCYQAHNPSVASPQCQK